MDIVTRWVTIIEAEKKKFVESYRAYLVDMRVAARIKLRGRIKNGSSK